MIVLCPHCKVKVRIGDEKIKPEGIKVRCIRCRNVFAVRRKIAPPLPPDSGKVKILLAHESEIFRKNIKDIIAKAGYTDVREAGDGAEALRIIEDQKPDIAILDVMLPKMFGFEITDIVKQNEKLKSTKILLIGDVYDKTRLRREPQTYYGADGYIEKPYIMSGIVDAISRLLITPAVTEKRPTAEPAPAIPRQPVEAIRPEVKIPLSEEEKREHEKAKRLARIIVSDIALYNPKLVEEGVKNSTFFTLLDKDIKQAQKLYREKVPEWLREKTNYLQNAFEEFIESKKKQIT